MLSRDKNLFYRGTIYLLSLYALLGSNSAQATLNVFACEPEWAALAKELGGDKLDIYAATTAMQDPHHIQARPSLIAKARRADLLICSGAELEVGWLPLLLRKASNENILPGRLGHFFAADYVDKLDVPLTLDRRQGDVHAEGNPHVHTNPENIMLIANALHQRLIKIDETHSDYYVQRFLQFEQQWLKSIKRWQELTSGLKGIGIVTHHTYWSYLNDWLGMEVLATLEPVAGVSPSSHHLSKLTKQIEQQDIKMIVHVAYVSERPSQWLAERISVPVIALPATVDFQNGQTLTQWFDVVFGQLRSVQ